MRNLPHFICRFFILILTVTGTVSHAMPADSVFFGVAYERFDYVRMQTVLNAVKESASLPVRQLEASQIETTNEPIDRLSQSLFNRLTKQVFGDPSIVLRACANCMAMADYESKTIFIQPSYAKELIQRYGPAQGRLALEFVLAHELSHFVHEASVGMGSVVNRSVNGTYSAYQRNEVVKGERTVQAGQRMHVEVDAYALMIMKMSHKKAPRIVERFCLDEMKIESALDDPDAKFFADGFEYRAYNAAVVIQDLFR